MNKIKENIGLQFFACLLLFTFLFGNRLNAQWTHSNLQVGAINSVFTNGNDLLAGFNGNGGSIIITQDNDVSWHYAETGIPSGADVRAFGANSLYVFAGTTSGLYRCNNDGNYNWSLVLNGGYWSLIVTDNDIFAGTLGAGLFHSTDNGGTWTSTTSGMSLYPDVYALASKGTYLFAGMYAGNGTANSPNAGVYRSSDNGATWAQKATGLTNYDVFSLLVKGNYIFAGTNGGVFRSSDNGDNWTYVAGGSVHSLKIVCGTDIYAGLLNHGGVSFSTDDGNTWTGDGLSGYAAMSLAILGTHLYAGTDGTGVFKSDIVCSDLSGSICGLKFNDLNGNGIQDQGEQGLANWIITLSYPTPASLITITDTTDANGNYCFNNLQPGETYTVSETNQTGWTQTFPASPGIYSIQLTSGQHKDSVNFGNKQLGSICGMKFNDLNGNGVRDSGEPGLLNWVINLTYQTAAGNQTITDTTDANGNYCFENLQPGGTYTVSEVNQTGWQQTFPASPGTYIVNLTSGLYQDTLNFGNHLTTTGTDSCHFLCNTDFEDNQVVSADSQGFFNETKISCWKTTERDSMIEVWGSGFGGVPAYSGNQFIELNAHTVGTLYQEFTAISGRMVAISFAHRGRYTNPDVMNVTIGPSGGPYTLLGTYSDNDSAWSYYTVLYTFPTGGPFELRFESVSSNGGAGPTEGGNFLDSISIDCPSAGGVCDSLRATASKITPGDCNWSLSLQQPANLSGVYGIQISCLSPNQFTTGTGLGPNFQNWFTSSNTYYPPTGHVPGGNLNDFFHMNINYTTSPQVIVVNWLDSLSNKVCSDTLRLDCQISCTTLISDTVACNANGYNFSYKFTNNATYSISNIEYTLQRPSGVTISPLADTLSPALAANATSSAQNIQISGGMPGDTVVIVAKFISSGGCCWCFETFNVILPNCASICDSLGVSASGSSADCCYSISLTNNSNTVFSSVEFQLISGGMYSTVSTTSAPGWAFTNVSPNNLINLVKLPFGQGIGLGTFNSVLDMCINQYPDSNQVIAVKWIKDGLVVCTDTLKFECISTVTSTDTCSQVIDGAMTCLQNGTIQYVFRVQNNSIINSTGFGIFPMTPGVSFSKTIFNNTNILPGQVSPIDTIIISGIGTEPSGLFANFYLCYR